MNEFVNSVAEEVGIDTGLAAKAVGTMLALVKSDGNPDLVRQLMDAMPEAEALADAHNGTGGLMGKLTGALGGGALAAFGKLTSAGLDTTQIKRIAEMVFDHARKRTSEELVKGVVRSIPGLKKFV